VENCKTPLPASRTRFGRAISRTKLNILFLYRPLQGTSSNPGHGFTVLWSHTRRRTTTAVLPVNLMSFNPQPYVHSCQQKSIGLKFSKSQTGSDVRYSCHHNSSRFTFSIFAHSCRFSVLHSLQSITPRIY